MFIFTRILLVRQSKFVKLLGFSFSVVYSYVLLSYYCKDRAHYYCLVFHVLCWQLASVLLICSIPYKSIFFFHSLSSLCLNSKTYFTSWFVFFHIFYKVCVTYKQLVPYFLAYNNLPNYTSCIFFLLQYVYVLYITNLHIWQWLSVNTQKSNMACKNLLW